MMKIKKTLGLLLALVMVASLATACGDSSGGGGDATTTKANDNGSGEETNDGDDGLPARDLGGKSFVIGNWWAGSDDIEIKSTYDEDLVAYREMIQEKYNCSIKVVNLCNWGEMQELAATSIMAGTPEAQVFTLDAGFTMPLFKQGLFYEVSSLPSWDPAPEKWNKLLIDMMTFDGKTYAFATGYEPRNGLFWNKRLYEEAGLDPDLPYDLQASDEWTWDKFLELCALLTRDTNNDAIIDTYAVVTFTNELFGGALAANNARYVGFENGKLYNATMEPNFLETCEFIRKLNDDGYVMPQPEDAEWDFFGPAFIDGYAAMRPAEEYNKGEMKDMVDDFGFVFFPKGPNGNLISPYRENIQIIPSCYDAQEADDILFAYDIWTNTVPGYEENDTWKIAASSAYRDARAVDETLEIMRAGTQGVLVMESFVPNLETGNIAWNMWDAERTPAEVLESIQDRWNSLIDDANTAFFE